LLKKFALHGIMGKKVRKIHLQLRQLVEV
jgi:hypothetical protein